ncbi:hypothetical protein GA0116948_1051 [Chitinophaga costaii]|uniref:Uncharacterized protein n=1 Tax=Chitinophaga costaii TaxID=1335309 RepID=A0A1C4CZY3_9BACT|nr:hypothetical protein [Chitinophaga costaii]PUZ24406.1 hypothetical protein DCM91_10790 [Chitinophaga costaii]SCC24764.1 hypothetical protein GA0116948_1051 [Chitinophaga costaii]
MKQKDILKAIRLVIDNELEKLGFVFKSKMGGYVKFHAESQLYFEISFLFLDTADYDTVLTP